MEPARATAPCEDAVPIDVLDLDLRDGGVATIRATQPRTRAETALHEVQSVAGAAAHAVIRLPDHGARVHAALQHEVLDETPNRVVGEGRDDRGSLVEAAPQAAGDVIFAAAFPGVQHARGVNASFA